MNHNRRITLGDTNPRFSRSDLNEDKIKLLRRLLNESRDEGQKRIIKDKIVRLGGQVRSKKKRR